LYGDFGANPNLKPEENLTIEAGIEYKMNDNFRISGVFFNREEKNTVLWIDGGYLNAADLLNARGVEVELNTTPIEKVSIEANYSFTEYKETLARRIPKHTKRMFNWVIRFPKPRLLLYLISTRTKDSKIVLSHF